MHESFTAGAARALSRARARARARGVRIVEPIDCLAALVDEPESRAAALLVEHGLDLTRLYEALGVSAVSPESDPDETPIADLLDLASLSLSAESRLAMHEAAHRARQHDRSAHVGTEHVLAGLLVEPSWFDEIFRNLGLEPERLRGRLDREFIGETGPILLSGDTPAPVLSEPGETADLGRILDASANRAGEGLRVIEDYIRFVLGDPMLTKRIKDVRHRLGAAVDGLDSALGREMRIAARDALGDVGSHVMSVESSPRENPRAVLTANFRRSAEALRSMEEYAKLIDVWLSGRFEVLRYDVYTLEKLVLTALVSHRTLAQARLYVLVGGLPTLGDLTWIVGEALAGGADVIQLREKGLPDREWLTRAREVRILTAQARARFVLNDRPDLARLAGADGVHLGQDDLSVRDTRRIIGPSALVGVSTHNPAQVDAALLDAASYLGVGPVYPSATKDFAEDEVAGIGLVRYAAETSSLPFFAIGGIGEANLDEVLEAGAGRVAVSSAILRADRPRQAARNLKMRLEQASAVS